jgi:hypothetical protein
MKCALSSTKSVAQPKLKVAMIKAEIITHEGNDRPTWFERCKSAITPATLSIFVAFVAIAVIIGSVVMPDKTEQGSVSTPAQVSESEALKVDPVQPGNANEAQSVAPLQPVTNQTQPTTNSQSTPQATSPTTPTQPQSFNAVDRPVDSITANPTFEQSQLGGGNSNTLFNGLQSTVDGIRGLVNRLGL